MLQSDVERRYFIKCSNIDALVRTVFDVWVDNNMDRVITSFLQSQVCDNFDYRWRRGE